MKIRFVCLFLIVGCLSFLNAEPDNGRFLPNKEPFSAENIFFELSGNINFPLPFYNEYKTDTRARTGFGGGFNFGAGYNLAGWLFGLEYTRDMWAGGKKYNSLMDGYFNSNIFTIKVQRVLSKNTIKVFPEWLSVVPGLSLGINFFGASYYKSKAKKNAGIRTIIPEFSKEGIVFYGRLSAEASFYLMEKDYLIPFVGADYNFFFDRSHKGGLAGFPRIMIGVRSYPWTKGSYQPPVFPATLTFRPNIETGFSPDGDGVNDNLSFSIKPRNLEFSPESWEMEIVDTEGHLVRNWEGVGTLPKKIEWDGYDNDGKLVTSANTYTAKLSAIPDVRDRERLDQEKVEAETQVKTGTILQEEIPNKRWRVVAAPLYFDSDAPTFDNITDDQKVSNESILDQIATDLSAHWEISKITVEGYANNVSNTEREDVEELIPLSQARAEAIAEILAQKGVRRNLLDAKGMGGANPIAKWEDRANWWRNRRVEFVLEITE